MRGVAVNTDVSAPLALPPGAEGTLVSSLQAWLRDMARPGVWLELAVLLLCLMVAGLLVSGWRQRWLARHPGSVGNGSDNNDGHSVWWGRRPWDGVLFPLLALGLALLARATLNALWPGVLPQALWRLVLPVLGSLAAIRLVAKVIHRAFPRSAVMRWVERSFSWLVWLAVVLWVTGLLPVLLTQLDSVRWRFGSTSVSLRDVLEGIVAAAVVLVLALWASAGIEARLLKGATDNLSVRKMAANAVRALLLFVGLVVALQAAGIDLTALGVVGGALGVGIGFGLQRLAANYISGFVILAERSMRIGDMVRMDGFEGRISDISTRYTVIRALNGRESIVPNEMMITQRVENNSLADPRLQILTTVQVAYGTDLPALMPQLQATLAAVPRVLADPAPAVMLSQFTADGLELTLAFWIADAHNGQLNVKSDVNLAVLALLNAQGVEIPYPQRVVRVERKALPAGV